LDEEETLESVIEGARIIEKVEKPGFGKKVSLTASASAIVERDNLNQ
jgi:Na+-translocating ferredoxin:NAD+ oxidoreductase RnfG subunit